MGYKGGNGSEVQWCEEEGKGGEGSKVVWCCVVIDIEQSCLEYFHFDSL